MGVGDNFIPEEDLPQCWSDDVRMNALFAPFRLKCANPESWDMKMKFWSHMLRILCRCKKDPTVTACDAKFAFQRKARTPACIDIVIEEMYRDGELSPISRYQQILHNGPEGWVSWGARLALKPAALALTAMTSLMPARQVVDQDGLPKASIDQTQRFVLESAVKEQAEEWVQNYPTSFDRIGTIDELMKKTKWQGSREIFEVLLGYLVTQGSAVKKNEVVKIAESEKKVTPITETDEALVKLLSTKYRLEDDAARLAKEIFVTEVEAKAALQIGNKLLAKNHLRRKHRLVQRADRCEATLENVNHLLNQMKEIEINSTIVDTYRVSSLAMSQEMKDGLDENLVHNTMDDLKEVLDNYNEVEKALGGTLEDMDATDLEQELNELLSGPGAPGGGTPSKEDRKEDIKLPSPPIDHLKRKISERDFVFDGEEKMLAELNDLSVQDASPKSKDLGRTKVALTEDNWRRDDKNAKSKTNKSRSWYPPAVEPDSNVASWSNNNLDVSLQELTEGFAEIIQDERLHPGQQLDVDYTRSPTLYTTDFQVRDHKKTSGVWLFNTKDGNSNDLTASTEYISSESPGKTIGSFQMAPGGERRRSQPWPRSETESNIDDLEKRLRNLRGFNS